MTMWVVFVSNDDYDGTMGRLKLERAFKAIDNYPIVKNGMVQGFDVGRIWEQTPTSGGIENGHSKETP